VEARVLGYIASVGRLREVRAISLRDCVLRQLLHRLVGMLVITEKRMNLAFGS
jgi:hypothetical protein